MGTDRLDALRSGEQTTQVVEGVLAAGQIAGVLEVLRSQPSHPLAPADNELGRVRQWGAMSGPTPLDPGGPSPARYAQRNSALWDALGDLAEPLTHCLLTAIRGLTDAPVEVARGRWPATIRCMPAGCGAPLHLDRYPHTESYAALRERCDLDAQHVWYLMLQAPEAGGVLRIFPGLRPEGQVPGVHDEAVEVSVPVGSLLIHAGARHWHEVTAPIGGDRITMGGICAPLLSGDGWRISG